jgi:hypothetical protein
MGTRITRILRITTDFLSERGNNGNADYTDFADYRSFLKIRGNPIDLRPPRCHYCHTRQQIRVLRVAIVAALGKPQTCRFFAPKSTTS